MTPTLAELRYKCKRYAAKPDLVQLIAVPRKRKPRELKEPKTPLHALFVRRVEEELKLRTLNTNSIKKFGAKQRTVWDAIYSGSDIRLSTIYKIATALGMMEAWPLLKERDSNNVIDLPETPKPITGQTEQSPGKKSGVRKKPSR